MSVVRKRPRTVTWMSMEIGKEVIINMGDKEFIDMEYGAGDNTC